MGTNYWKKVAFSYSSELICGFLSFRWNRLLSLFIVLELDLMRSVWTYSLCDPKKLECDFWNLKGLQVLHELSYNGWKLPPHTKVS